MSRHSLVPQHRLTDILDTSDGLRAVSWESGFTGKTLGFGSGPEVEFDIGLPDKFIVTPKLRVSRAPDAAKGARE